MREMRKIGVGMQGMRWECGCGELAWDCGKTGGNAKHVGNQGDLKFVFADISVSCLRSVSKYKNLFMLYLQRQLKSGFIGEH